MVVTYEQIEVWSYNFCHCVRHEQGNRLLGKFFLYWSFFIAFKGEIHEENWSRTIISTWRKQVPITYVSLSLLLQNKDFPTRLEQANKMMSRFLLLGPPFTKKETFKTFTEFFQQLCKYAPNIFNALCCKFSLVQLCPVFAIGWILPSWSFYRMIFDESSWTL